MLDHTGWSHIQPRRRANIEVVDTLPELYYQFPEVKLYTGGSDAHVISEIGSGMLVNDPAQPTRAAIWQTIITNRRTNFYQTTVNFHLWFGFYKIYSVVCETFIKAFRLYEGKIYQNDDRFTNYYSEAEKESVLELRRWRVHWLKPILNFLTYFGVSPTHLNAVEMIAILVSLALVWQSVAAAVVGFCVYLMTAGLVGPLARYQNVETEQGAITKIILYIFSITAVVLSAIALHWIEPVWGATYLVLYILMLWLTIALNRLGRPIRLIIRSRPLLLLAIILFIGTNLNLLTPLVIVLSWYMAVVNGLMLLRLRQAVR